MVDVSPRTVFLMTDYGLEDEFVGILHAVIARAAPEARVVDLSHGVVAGDVRGGAEMLERSMPWLAGGVVVAIVDPGVGSGRRAVAVQAADPGTVQAADPGTVQAADPGTVQAADPGTVLVGPDNGLLVPALEASGGAGLTVELGTGPYPAGSGRTFDGRDVFAPAAAALCRGTALTDLGRAIAATSLVRLAPERLPVAPAGMLVTTVRWVDRFGNVQLGLEAAGAGTLGAPGASVEVALSQGGAPIATLRRVGAFAELGPGELGLVADAYGRLAVVADRRSASAMLRLGAGRTVFLRGTG